MRVIFFSDLSSSKFSGLRSLGQQPNRVKTESGENDLWQRSSSPVHDAVLVARLHRLDDLAEERPRSVLRNAALGHQLVEEGSAGAMLHDLRRSATAISTSGRRELANPSCARRAP